VDVKGEAELSTALSAARERAGLSARALARCSGVSQAAVSAIERGREPRWSTLQALCSALPGLDPGPVLGCAPDLPLPASIRSWRFLARLHGFQAERLVLALEGDAEGVLKTTVTLEGLRCSLGTLASPARRIELAAAAYLGPGRLLRELGHRAWHSRGGRVRLRDGGVSHEFKLPRAGRDGALDYRRVEKGRSAGLEPSLPRDGSDGAPFQLGGGVLVDLPVRELVLRVSLRGRDLPQGIRLHAWAPSLTLGPGQDRPAWRHLFPDAPELVAVPAGARSRRLEIIVRKPPPGLAYGLDWGGEAGGPWPAPPPAVVRGGRLLVTPSPPLRSLAAAVKRLRRRAGSGQRELARAVGVSPSTITRWESGELEPGLSTLAGLLRAWPWASPWALVRPGRASSPLEAAEAWEEQRRQFGAWAESDSRSNRVRVGWVDGRSTTRGLRAATPVRLRLGVTRTLQVKGGWELLEVTARRTRGDELKVRVMRRGAGPVVHELILDGRGVDVERRVRLETDELPGEWRLAPSHPTGQVVLELSFSREAWPGPMELLTVPRCVAAYDQPLDIAHLLPSGAARLDIDAEKRRARVVLLQPLMGVRWVLRPVERARPG